MESDNTLPYNYKRIVHFKEKLHKIEQKHDFQLPDDVKQQLCIMFQQVQEPYRRLSPPEKQSFISYSLLIHRLLQSLKENSYAQYFPLLKSKEKMHYSDKLLKRIFIELGWNHEFIKLDTI